MQASYELLWVVLDTRETPQPASHLPVVLYAYGVQQTGTAVHLNEAASLRQLAGQFSTYGTTPCESLSRYLFPRAVIKI